MLTFIRTMIAMCKDAWAYIVDPEAGMPSHIKFPSGRPMSVREAKQKGLM